MAIEYPFSRIEAKCVCKAVDPDEGTICEVVVGMSATDGNYSAYIETTAQLTGVQRVAGENLDLSSICNECHNKIHKNNDKYIIKKTSNGYELVKE